jgi:hypothetical protein
MSECGSEGEYGLKAEGIYDSEAEEKPDNRQVKGQCMVRSVVQGFMSVKTYRERRDSY